MVDFPSGVSATNPTTLLGSNGTSPAKAALSAFMLEQLAANGVTDVNDTAYPITVPDRIVAVRRLTAPRTQTLPEAVGSGRRHLVLDSDGTCMPMTRISVAPNGTDTINGRNAAVRMWAPQSCWEFIDVAAGKWIAMPSLYAIGYPGAIARHDYFIFEDDCFGSGSGANGYFSASTSTGSVSGNSPGGSGDSTAKGTYGLIPGTGAGHYGGIRGPTAGNAFVFRQWSRIVVEFLASVRTLHDATNDSMTTWGLCEPLTTSDVANGAVFQIDRATNATNILSVTASGSTRTKTSTTIGHASNINGWNRFTIDMTPGTDAKFYIDDTLRATVSTNLPSAASTSSASLVAQARWIAGAMASAAISIDRVRAVYVPNLTYARPD